MLWDSKKAGLNRRQIWIVGLAIPVVYGGLIEVLQELFFYPRTGEWSDWLADGVGVFIGAVIWWISQKMVCKRNGSIE
jgi:VanZ family protein